MSTKDTGKFQPKRSQNPSKGGLSKGSGGSGSKNVNAGVAGGAGKTNQIPCFHNGKLATPQSLLPRKSSEQAPKSKTKTEGVAIPQPIEENAVAMSAPLTRAPTHTNLAEKNSRRDMASSSMNKKLSSGYASMGSKYGEEKVVEEMTVVHLTETVTEIVLRIPSLIFASDAPHKDLIVLDDNNARYEAVVAAHKNSDAFCSNSMQTINNPTKVKEEMTSANSLKDSGSQALSYDILDSTKTSTAVSTDHDHVGAHEVHADITVLDDSAGVGPSVKKFVGDGMSVALASGGCLLDTTTVGRPEIVTESRPAEGRKDIKGRGKKAGSSSHDAGAPTAVENSTASGLQAPPSQQLASMESGELSGGRSGGGTSGLMHGGVSTAGDGGGDRITYSEQDSLQVLREKQAQAIITSKSLLKKLNLIERAVQQNAYHKEHLDYRDLPDIVPLQLSGQDKAFNVETDQLFGGGFKAAVVEVTEESVNPETDDAVESVAEGQYNDKSVNNGVNTPFTRKLFCWANIDLVRGRSVTCMAANTANNDIMAVGYGKLDTIQDEDAEDENSKSYGGLVLFWSLRNPDYPEKILRTPHPVTALNFSNLSPTIIAVGLYNGELMIYDVKRETDWGTPVESSQNIAGGHSDPIWNLKWVVTKASERVETLVSISTDGNVLQWSIKKGLVVSTLMQLKRGGVGEGWISRAAAGMCFDFLPDDPTRYVTGTEEGSVHLSNVSHNEQYLDTYESHNGPVYRTSFSRVWPEVFLTSSADWTMGLYHVRMRAPMLKFHTTGADFAINDLAWCPGNSTVFAAVTEDGKIQLWDLNVSCIDPVTIIDTNADPALWAAGGIQSTVPADTKTETEDDLDAVSPGATALLSTGASAGAHRGRQETEKRDEDTPVTKLLKNLQQLQQNKRSLTSVLFSEHSPILIVGDSRGVVTLYRVLKPSAVTTESKLERSRKLRQAILKQADPALAAKLNSFDGTNK